jgi:S-adenosylmethionine:tRNA ribosyltransferase-isomerase
MLKIFAKIRIFAGFIIAIPGSFDNLHDNHAIPLMKNENYNIANYSYHLPEERIAKYPEKERNKSKLLVYDKGRIEQGTFDGIGEYLPGGATLIFNNSKVVHARLSFQKSTGARVEIFCLSPVYPSNYEEVFTSRSGCKWKCMIGNLKKWKGGSLAKEVKLPGGTIILKATCTRGENKETVVDFSWNGEATFAEVIKHAGNIPLPPYLKRDAEPGDAARYQTVYSKVDGSVAAPTAGLHFTSPLLENLKSRGIKMAELTLHVGAGTFQPVKVTNFMAHEMHTERIIITSALIENLLETGGNIIAVGTTSARALESIYWIGAKLKLNLLDYHNVDQFQYRKSTAGVTIKESLESIQQYMHGLSTPVMEASTSLMIVPGYPFKMVRGLITNFHQPGSTLLLLIAAFIGDGWGKVYDYALDNDFRFLSYGDSSLLLP